MNLVRNPVRLKAAATYDAASDNFDAAPLGFWVRHGERAVQRLALKSGDWVLDVGCGTGASALPAAEVVGNSGQVIGIDVAENMLALARSKAAAQGLQNTHFELADMMNSGYASETFHAVVSVFSVFFVADMEMQTAEFWRMLRPGGQLAMTVWGPGAFQPVAQIFGEELVRRHPGKMMPVRPWERLTEPENLRALLRKAGAYEMTIEFAEDRQSLRTPEDAWVMVMGSGFRWEVEQLNPEDRGPLRDAVVRRVADEGVTEIETSALHAKARKPL